uniref:Uncharacterized protein n=1 Tax=Cyprinus carpio TaxID=7962 RepID=A0A8C1LFZ4_CYPCA
RLHDHRRKSELHEKDYGGQKAIYWEVKYPLPLSNRDVSYKHIKIQCACGNRQINVKITILIYSISPFIIFNSNMCNA